MLSPGDQVKAFIASGAWYRHLTSLLALAGVITLGAAMLLWALKPSMVPVYGNLSQQDALTVTDTLRADNIPFEIQRGTGLVLVPADQLDSIRLKLAATGISTAKDTGIEMLQKDQSLGTSRFIENARYHHAMETELSRTISSMKNIDTARVHLAIPKQSVFIRNRAKPSASVMVKMMPGRSLEGEQVSAIIHLVASSIPYLESGEVTIVDQWGRLLSDGDEGNGLGAVRKQFDYQRKLESNFTKRIEDLLTPILGAGNVRAKVNADVDFTYNESTREAYDGDPAKIRSEQTQENQTRGSGAAIGIPGALSNQPPGAGTTKTNGKKGDKADAAPTNISTQATRNYELDRTISHSRTSVGRLKRLSVAVLVDDRTTVDETGETVKTPLSEEEITTLTNIVKKAIGYDEKRGDSVAVFNQSFQPVEEPEPVAGPAIWEQPWVWSMAKQVLTGIGIILLVLLVARPAVRNLLPAPAQLAASDKEHSEGNDNDALADDHVSLSHNAAGNNGQAPQLTAPPHAYGDVLNLARGLANEDPKRVAKLIKDWVANNA
jgi:flagellar M-ring protein FliF